MILLASSGNEESATRMLSQSPSSAATGGMCRALGAELYMSVGRSKVYSVFHLQYENERVIVDNCFFYDDGWCFR